MRETLETGSFLLPIRKYPLISALVFVLVIVGTLFYVRFAPRVYEAAGGVLVSGTHSVSALATLSSGTVGLDAAVGSQKDILSSETVLRQAGAVVGWTGSLSELKSRIRIDSKLTSSYLHLVTTGESPEEAARLCNALLDAYDHEVKKQWRENALLDKDYWEQRQAQANATLTKAEDTLEEFKRSHHLLDPQVQVKLVTSAESDAESQLEALRVAYARDIARLGLVKRQLEQNPELVMAARRTQENPVYSSLQSQLAAVGVQLAEAKAQYTDEHPKLRTLRLQAEALRQRLADTQAEQTAFEDTAASPIHQQLLTTYLTLNAQIAANKHAQSTLKAQLAANQSTASKLPALETKYTRLQRNVSFAEQVLQEIVNAYEQAKTASTKSQSAGWIVQRAEPLARPVYPRPVFSTALGLLLAVILALLVGSALDQFDPKVRCLADIQRLQPDTLALAAPNLRPESLVEFRGALAAYKTKFPAASIIVCGLEGLTETTLREIAPPPDKSSKDNTNTQMLICANALTNLEFPSSLSVAQAAVLLAKSGITARSEMLEATRLLTGAGVGQICVCLVS